MHFANLRLSIQKFIAKIGQTNIESFSLFKNKLKFQQISYCEVFQEYTLLYEYSATDAPTYRIKKLPEEKDDICEIVLSQFISLHFGEDMIVHDYAPTTALRFPQRCADLVIDQAQRLGINMNAVLDVGCAVGGSCVELAKKFKSVNGIDISKSFIDRASHILEKNTVSYWVPVSGSQQRLSRSSIDPLIDKSRIRFDVQDACSLNISSTFDAILAANLLCRLHDPLAFLQSLPSITCEKALVVIVTPFSWLEEFTSPEKWISEQDLILHMQCLGFELKSYMNIPSVIREHERKYQYIVSKANIFLKN